MEKAEFNSAKTNILVIDTLGIWGITYALQKYKGVHNIFYIHEARDVLSKILVMMLKKRSFSFTPIEQITDSYGGPFPRMEVGKVQQDMACHSKEAIFTKALSSIKGISKYERERVLGYFNMFANYEMTHPAQLFAILNKIFPEKKKIIAVLFEKNLFSNVIADLYKKEGLTTDFYKTPGRQKFVMRKNFRIDQSILRCSGYGVRDAVRIVVLIFYSIFCKVKIFILRQKKEIKKHKICALTIFRIASVMCNSLPWMTEEKDELKDETLSLYPPTMPDAERTFHRNRSGKLLKFSMNPFKADQDPELAIPWSYFINYLTKNIKLYWRLFGFSGLKRWMSKYLIRMLLELSFFESLFHVNGTKLVWLLNEDVKEEQMVSVAINRLNGIALSTAFSHGLFPELNNQHNKIDIYFVWGRRMMDVRRDIKDISDSLVIVGHPADKFFGDEIVKAYDFRKSIMEKYNPKRILTFYDTASGPDGIVTKRDIVSMYKVFFKWLEEDRGNFLIIKAKTKHDLAQFPEIESKVKDLCDGKRALIVYERAVIYPGLAADFMMSTSPTLASLAALFGCAFIFYDIHKIYEKYPFNLPNVKVLKDTLHMEKDFYEAFEKSIWTKGKDGFCPIRGSAIDPFVDGKAASRMREYMKNLLNALSQGETNADAVVFANNEHRKKWGNDTVKRGPLHVGCATRIDTIEEDRVETYKSDTEARHQRA